MSHEVADPSTTARWSAAKSTDRIVPQWSLRQSCLCLVKDSVLGWSRGRRNSVDQSNNPFQEYPIDLRHELLNHLLRLKPTGRELLKAAELLVSSGIPAFDLSCLDDCKFCDVRTVLESLIKTGNCLRELVLAGQWLYHPLSDELAERALKSCPNLLHLKLQHTTCGGKELQLVLKHCPKLKKLEVLHPSVNECEIYSLAETVHSDPETYQSAINSLVELRLPSSVGGRGTLSLLRLLPQVRRLGCTHLDEVIDELEALTDPVEISYWRDRASRVDGLNVSLPVSYDTPELVADWFPNLEEISLEVQDETDLKPIASLRRLRSLELKNSPTLPISYMDEILPLLSACGSRLSSLSLERFDLIDLTKTTTHCPNLRAFSAQWFTVLSVSASNRRPVKQFLDLRYLRLRPRVGRRVTPEACELLLSSSACLKHLEFYCSYGLTDTLITKLLKTNRFSQLRTLLLRHGHGLSARGILQLTQSAQNLRAWDVGSMYSKPA